jgi:hypothetical protein
MLGMRSNFAALVLAFGVLVGGKPSSSGGSTGLIVAAGGCSSSGGEDVVKSGSAACAGSVHPEPDRDVSFASEVMPLFQTSCAFVSCHGSPSKNNGIYLGSGGADGAGASEARAALLEVAPSASMPFVTPGKPDRSFLIRKLDGDFCGLTCEGGCGERMPKGGAALAPAALTTIATWIANGAPDN